MGLDLVPEPINARVQQGGWVPVDLLGEGGGGKVFLCVQAELFRLLEDFRRSGGTVISATDTLKGISKMIRCLNRSLVEEKNALSAVKIPKALDDPATGERLKREIAAMKATTHGSLIRLLASDEEDPPQWFSMQVHRRGTLMNSAKTYYGNVVKTLEAIRPIAEGMRQLHDNGYVHRDIKPNNIFLAENGELILGDFGIVFPREQEGDRLTNAGMTLFSRDWIPDWMRFSDSDPQPKVDVFMLAKVVYYMVTGGGKVLASQLDEEAFDLRHRINGKEGANELQEFLMSCITPKERDCKMNSAGEFLAGIDELLSRLKGTAQTDLIFNFLSVHSTTDIPVIGNPGEIPRYPSLTGIEVFFPGNYKSLRARVRLIGPQRLLNVSVYFQIDGMPSHSCKDIQLNPSKGTWTDEFGLDSQFKRGWHKLDVLTRTMIDGVRITGFALYGK